MLKWMRVTFRLLSSLAKYFGVVECVRLALTRYTAKSYRKVRLPFTQHPVVMRTGKSSDLWVLNQIFARNEYESVSRLQDVRTIIDCGANVGYASVSLLNMYPNARVIAVEPDPHNYKVCVENLRPYGDRAVVIHAAVWSTCGTVSLALDEVGREWATRVETRGPGGIPAVDIPHLMRLHGVDEIDLLKIDIEGSEIELFRDCDEWMPHVRNLTIELHGPECEQALRSAVANYDCDMFEAGDITVCLDIQQRKAVGSVAS